MQECPKCKSKNIIAVEYIWDHPYHYDGVSEYHCIDCKYRQGRWSEKELAPDEVEAPLGKGVVKFNNTELK